VTNNINTNTSIFQKDRLSHLFLDLVNKFIKYDQKVYNKEREIVALSILKIISERRKDIYAVPLKKFLSYCSDWSKKNLVEPPRHPWLAMAPLLIGKNILLLDDEYTEDNTNEYDDVFQHLRFCVQNLDHHNRGYRQFYYLILYIVEPKFYIKRKTEIAMSIEANLRLNHFDNELGLFSLKKLFNPGTLRSFYGRWIFFHYHHLSTSRKFNQSDIEYIEQLNEAIYDTPEYFKHIDQTIDKLYTETIKKIKI